MRHWLSFAILLLFHLSLGACDLIDEPCPEGYWRPRAMEECEPVPTYDAGTDSGAGTTDGGADDAATPADGGSPADAGAEADAATPADAAVDAGAQADAATPADAAVDDGGVDAG